MITVYPYEQLGRADHGWLDARHHFSFARYYNPSRKGFGTLRVINDDIVKAGAGFDTHPHRDMEIITYVRKGAITHKDSAGNVGRTEAGDLQVMSAGTGIFHSEFNLESEDTNLYQIWIEPSEKGVIPRWDMKQFPKEPVTDKLSLLVSGNNDAPLYIHQDAQIYGGRLTAGTSLTHSVKHQAYILVSEGSAQINTTTLKKGDGAEVTDTNSLAITALTDTEILIIDAPAAA
ncbi:pirin family protein [Kordiimonas pumila]|uniref:Pirin family protein n=1 Tax=Kordiimonas pumila TaxID=2161677 RepID=A0ABV7D0L4_9PROT|nr:pirin family protein [Kordiimonas pumila]